MVPTLRIPRHRTALGGLLVLNGIFYSPQIIQEFFSAELVRHAVLHPQSEGTDMGLTRREQEVLKLLVSGADNARIARGLLLSPKMQNNADMLLAKLQAAPRAHLVAIGRDLDIGN